MGYSKTRVKLLYFYEAFVLVVSSCLLGVMIGTIVGFTFIVQQVVFSGIPIIFYFPWMQFIVIVVVSIVSSFVASWGPAS